MEGSDRWLSIQNPSITSGFKTISSFASLISEKGLTMPFSHNKNTTYQRHTSKYLSVHVICKGNQTSCWQEGMLSSSHVISACFHMAPAVMQRLCFPTHMLVMMIRLNFFCFYPSITCVGFLWVLRLPPTIQRHTWFISVSHELSEYETWIWIR